MGIQICFLFSLIVLFFVVVGFLSYITRQAQKHKAAFDKQLDQIEFYEVSKKILEMWVRQKKLGKSFASYFEKRGIKNIAIYGMSQTGVLFYEELKDSGVNIVCGIDRSLHYAGHGLEIIKPDEINLAGFENRLDAIVVIPVRDFSEIYDFLNPIFQDRADILGIDDILCSI